MVCCAGRGTCLDPGVTVEWCEDSGLFGWPGALSRLREHPARAFGVTRFVGAAMWTLSRLGPFDRVVAHWIVPCAWPVALSLNAPLEVVAHGSDVRLLLSWPRAWRRWLMNRLLAQGASFRFVSSHLRDQLTSVSPAELRLRSVVAPCPVDLDGVLGRRDARTELGVSRAERLVVLVGRLVTDKRIQVALNAALLIPRARVVVVGEGPEREALERQFPTAEFAGHCIRSRALRWIAASDLLVCASRLEGAPTVIREARALGVPVVCAPCGDVAQWARTDPGIIVCSE